MSEGVAGCRAGLWLLRAVTCLVALAVGLPSPCRAATGGPDTFGYTWKDGAEPGVTYQWEDISTTGTDITQTSDDTSLGWQPLSFSFPFYGVRYNQVAVSPNGWVSFTDGASAGYTDGPLPSPSEPHGCVAALWDDLATTIGTSHVYFQDTGTRAIITWQDAHSAQDMTLHDTFQVILEADGRIRVQVAAMATDPASCTMGIEKGTEDDGLTVFSDVAAGAPAPPYVVQFLPPSSLPTTLDCTAAVPLACGDTRHGDLSQGVANQSQYACSATDLPGREQVYRIDLAGQTSFHVALAATSGQPVAMLLSACDPNLCLAGPSTSLDAVDVQGTYYVVVDCPSGGEGAYDLTMSCVDCQAAQALSCGDTVFGDLSTGTSQWSSYSCPGDFSGHELAYRFDLATPTDVQVTLQAFSGAPHLLLLNACDPTQCTDLGAGTTRLPGFVGAHALVVDSASGQEGTFQLSVECLGHDFPVCNATDTFHGQPWGPTDGEFLVDGWMYPISDTSRVTLRVDGTNAWSHVAGDCPQLNLVDSAASEPAGPGWVTWDAPGGRLRIDVAQTQADTCCGLLFTATVTNTDVVPHFYEPRLYLDTAFGPVSGTCTTPTGLVDGGPITVRGTSYLTETDLVPLGIDSCDGQVTFYSALDTVTPRASFEMLPPNFPDVAEFIRYDDGATPCTQWSGFVTGSSISQCGEDNSILLAWRLPATSGTLAPGESASAQFRVGDRCQWTCAVACDPPVMTAGTARDIRSCNTGIVLQWDAATFPAGGHGVYHVFRSTVDAADALAHPPLTPPGGLLVTTWVDPSTASNATYTYVVMAESTDLPGCGTGPFVEGSTATITLGPVTDAVDTTGPSHLVGPALRLREHGTDQVDLLWPTAPAPLSNEAFVIRRWDGNPTGPPDTLGRTPAMQFTDPAATPRFTPPHVWFYDVRLSDDCGYLSAD